MDAWTPFRRARLFLFSFLTVFSLAWSGLFIAVAAKEWDSLSGTQRSITIILLLFYASSGIWTYLMAVILFHPRREFGRVGALLLVQSGSSTVFTIFGPGIPHQTVAINFLVILVGCWTMTALVLVYSIALCVMAVHIGHAQDTLSVDEDPSTPSILGLSRGSHASASQGSLGDGIQILTVDSKREPVVTFPRPSLYFERKDTRIFSQSEKTLSRQAIDHYARLQTLRMPESQTNLPRSQSSRSFTSLSESASSYGFNIALSPPRTPPRPMWSQANRIPFSEAFERLESPDSSRSSSTGWSSPSNRSVEMSTTSISPLLGSISSPAPVANLENVTRPVARSANTPTSPPHILSPPSAYSRRYAPQEHPYPSWRGSLLRNAESSPTPTSRASVAPWSMNAAPIQAGLYESSDPHRAPTLSPGQRPPRAVRFHEHPAHISSGYEVPQELSPQTATIGRTDTLPPADRVSARVARDDRGLLQETGAQGQRSPLKEFGGNGNAGMPDYPRWKRLAIEARASHL